MAKVNFPIQVNLTRSDAANTPMQPSEVAKIDVRFSLDGGTNFTPANGSPFTPASLPANIVVDGIDPGFTVILEASETDTQSPPRTSSFSRQSFTVASPPVVLAAPNPPVLGTPFAS